MDIDKLLELSSIEHKTDKSLAYKSKMKFIKTYLEEGRKPSIETEDDEVLSRRYPEPYDPRDDDSWTASEFDIPYKGTKMEGLRVCISVISGMSIIDPKTNSLVSGYDWRRKRFAVESAYESILNGKRPPKYVKDLKSEAIEVRDLFIRHEEIHNLSEDEKQKIYDFAEKCGDMLQDAFQEELDKTSEGSSGGKANIARMKNLIPCKFEFKGKTFYGMVVVADPNKKSAMIVWSSDTLDKEGNVAVQDTLVRRYWQMKATEAVLEPRLFNGSVRLIGSESLRVDNSDAKELTKANVSFDDSDNAKEMVLNYYLETLEKLRNAGVVKNDKNDMEVLRLQVGWPDVLKDFGFWNKIKSIV